MQIRKVTPSDNEQLAKIIRTSFIEHDAPLCGTVYSDPTTDNLFVLFQSEGAVLWVAETEGEIAGCCGIYPTEGLPERCAELVKFYLAAHARGKGVGRALMQQSIASAIELGYAAIYLESLPQFSNALSIYEKQGFKKLDHPLGKSGHTSCNVWMIKNL
ncbi:MAG: GNAT family N-acetyltransferase [Chitinophagaceae bacterium]|jgi:putative acetyltransferase|nr:GNAT family N-acetyltransferase [Chitinophagaceae bacterium]